MREKLLSVLKALFTSLLVLSGSIAVPLLVRPFYHLHIKPLELERASGLTYDQIRQAYDGVMDYCLGLQDSFSAGLLPFSESGEAHFADVRALFLLDLWVLGLSAAALLLLGLYCRYKAVACHRFRGHGPAFWGCTGLGVAFILIGALAAIDFDRAFVVFHSLFFPGKDNWIFHPKTDPVILLLPQVFFRNCAILILAVLIVSCMVIILRDKRHP